MSLYDACNLPWVDTVVNAYASNSSNIYSDTRLFNCCTSPGVCPNNYTGKCPYGNLDCTIGNSKYVCRFNDYSSASSQTCYQEGSLAITRNKPCCPNMLSSFLKKQSCLEGTGSSYDDWVCCPNGPETCQFVMGCIGYQGFMGHLGLQYAVYSGFVSGLSSTGSSYCVEEVSLGAAKSSYCYAVGGTGCSLGGVTPPPLTNVTTTTTIATTPVLPTTRPAISTGGSGTGPAVVSPTNKGSSGNSVHGDGGRTVKKAALLLFVPLILQLDFI
ncbi:hypothetical protein BGZ47_011540 [Haplosporangium gracile]|nr:hypothetical protein BGZ47_011540 [Haplosporangium gracile]